MGSRIDVASARVRQLSGDQRQDLRRLTVSQDSYMASVMDDHPDTARCWIAGMDGRVVAWSLLRWFEPQVRAPHNAYLSVCVNPAARGKGIGRELVRAAMAYSAKHQLRPCFYGATHDQCKFYRACGAPPESIACHAFPRTYWAHCRFAKNGLRER